MPLRGEQRALLQLLCERGQSYEDISGLLGKTPDEVREDARGALQEIGGADPDAHVGLTDYLLGQADPIGRADATRYLQSNPETLDLAKRIESGLLLVAPEANLPKLPEPRGKRARAAMPAAGEVDSDDRESRAVPLGGGSGERSGSQGRLIAIIAGAGVILIIAILAISGVFSGDDSSASGSGDETTATTADPADATRNVTTVNLDPVDGSGVAGSAKFGIANQSQLFVDVNLKGLVAPKRGDALLVWLMVGPAGGYPINNPVETPIAPDQNGNFSGSIAVPSAIALTVGDQATSVKVSSSSIKDIAKAAQAAAQSQAPILGFQGQELASGDIPLANDKQSAGSEGGGDQGG